MTKPFREHRIYTDTCQNPYILDATNLDVSDEELNLCIQEQFLDFWGDEAW